MTLPFYMPLWRGSLPFCAARTPCRTVLRSSDAALAATSSITCVRFIRRQPIVRGSLIARGKAGSPPTGRCADLLRRINRHILEKRWNPLHAQKRPPDRNLLKIRGIFIKITHNAESEFLTHQRIEYRLLHHNPLKQRQYLLNRGMALELLVLLYIVSP